MDSLHNIQLVDFLDQTLRDDTKILYIGDDLELHTGWFIQSAEDEFNILTTASHLISIEPSKVTKGAYKFHYILLHPRGR